MNNKTNVAAGWSFARIGGVAGLVFAATIVAPNLILEPAGLPRVGAELDEVTAFFTTKSDVVGWSLYFLPTAWLSLTIFGAAAVAALWPRERATGSAWSLVGFAGMLLQNATFVGISGIRLALTTTTDRSGLWTLHNAMFTVNGTFLALAMLGLSLAGLRTGTIARWHGTLGLIAAAGQFLSATLVAPIIDHTGPLTLLSLASWLLWVVWIVAYGVTLIRLRRNHLDDQRD
ncbi:hypothetical protein [Nocardia callitridis]|uniref:DUF4386 family protein n=1 Tax=Nocardia callitridis TaxID=648753 RepID=A0ABP9KG33_9NOCA